MQQKMSDSLNFLYLILFVSIQAREKPTKNRTHRMVEGDSIKNKSDCKYAKCAFEIINYDNLV